MWAFVPTFGLRIVAIFVAMGSLVYFSYRGLWAYPKAWARHTYAILAILIVGVVAIIQLGNQWKTEHPSESAANAAPQLQSPPSPISAPPQVAATLKPKISRPHSPPIAPPIQTPTTPRQLLPTPASPIPTVGSVSQGPGSAFSVGQQGDITAGTINVDTRRRISVSDTHVIAMIDAMKPFAGRGAFVLRTC